MLWKFFSWRSDEKRPTKIGSCRRTSLPKCLEWEEVQRRLSFCCLGQLASAFMFSSQQTKFRQIKSLRWHWSGLAATWNFLFPTFKSTHIHQCQFLCCCVSPWRNSERFWSPHTTRRQKKLFLAWSQNLGDLPIKMNRKAIPNFLLSLSCGSSRSDSAHQTLCATSKNRNPSEKHLMVFSGNLLKYSMCSRQLLKINWP